MLEGADEARPRSAALLPGVPMTPLEKAAIAGFNKAREANGLLPADIDPPLLNSWTAAMRAALATLMEPTEEMIVVGVEVNDTRNPNDECPRPREIKAAWQAMLKKVIE